MNKFKRKKFRVKDQLYEKQNKKCHWCSRRISLLDATFDHIVPRSKGGGRKDNLVLACQFCNWFRAATPHEEFKEILEVIRKNKMPLGPVNIKYLLNKAKAIYAQKDRAPAPLVCEICFEKTFEVQDSASWRCVKCNSEWFAATGWINHEDLKDHE